MKVMHIEAGRFLYGGAQQVVWLTQGLADRNVENVLVCPIGSEIGAAVDSRVSVREIKMNGDADVGLIWRLMSVIREDKPDLIHLHSRRGADVFGGLAARWLGIPCVLSRRVDNPETRWWIPLKYGLFRRVIVISDAIGRVLASDGVDAKKLVSVRSAVDARLYQCEPERPWFDAEFALPENALTLGMVAQLIPRKGHRYLFEVLPDLLEAYPSLHVLIFGKGPLADEFSAHVAEDKFDGRVRLVGFRTDLRRVMPNLYAVVHPADREGLGVSLLQASACGVPVIAARAGGIPEIVLDGKNGVTFEVGDKKGLAGALQLLLSDSSLRDAMGQEGRRLASDDFSIDAMVDGNLAVYKEVVSG